MSRAYDPHCDLSRARSFQPGNILFTQFRASKGMVFSIAGFGTTIVRFGKILLGNVSKKEWFSTCTGTPKVRLFLDLQCAHSFYHQLSKKIIYKIIKLHTQRCQISTEKKMLSLERRQVTFSSVPEEE